MSRSSRIDCVLRNSEALSNRPISDPVIPALLFAAGSETSPLAFLPTDFTSPRNSLSTLFSHSFPSQWLALLVADLLRHLQARPPNPSLALPIFQQANLFLQFSTLFRRNAVFLTSIFAGAFAFEIAFDSTSNALWDALNRGRQWKDIKGRYLTQGEAEDEE
ncbi:Ubiquinol-cytochrome C reductase [Aspergillus sclerotialis]|uniref:Complex III subunit 9 n=1 Tax=Aspergillus sclerotialis TaxID=2070753 RepID=A0A3A2ZUS4_9EURO|nr:Ubiquinol-cytochrome C reductase [Aspergillus sclerotialis]